MVWRLLGHDPADVGTIAAWAVAVSMQVVGALLLLGPVEFHSGPGLDTREWTSDGPVWPHRQR